ncbi:MAG TPA: hypothetical protein VKY44_03955 [Flavobacterium sp.]|nr:hypothetical protein [Flavobacterium sp.]
MEFSKQEKELLSRLLMDEFDSLDEWVFFEKGESLIQLAKKMDLDCLEEMVSDFSCEYPSQRKRMSNYLTH